MTTATKWELDKAKEKARKETDGLAIDEDSQEDIQNKQPAVLKLTIFGEVGVSEPLDLNNNERDQFHPGKTDKFDVRYV